MRRLIELSRYVVALPALGAIIGSFVLMAIGLWDVGASVVQLFQSEIAMKESVVSILAAVDTLLLATVLMVIGYGLYELFVDDSVQLPAWLEIRSLDDLKAKLIGVVVAIIAVVFLGILTDATNAADVMTVGIGAGAVLVGLAAFTFASRK
ncbi:MAG: YqhA family protein [Actinomycetales bacterium]|nr:YqhA family protein [Actinomycetales bacterium]